MAEALENLKAGENVIGINESIEGVKAKMAAHRRKAAAISKTALENSAKKKKYRKPMKKLSVSL